LAIPGTVSIAKLQLLGNSLYTAFRLNAREASSQPTLVPPSRLLLHFCNKRNTAEQWIKEGKYATHWTRLSCHRPR